MANIDDTSTLTIKEARKPAFAFDYLNGACYNCNQFNNCSLVDKATNDIQQAVEDNCAQPGGGVYETFIAKAGKTNNHRLVLQTAAMKDESYNDLNATFKIVKTK